MTDNSLGYHGDPEGLLVKDEIGIEGPTDVVLTGLTPAQVERITHAVAEALREGSRTSRFAGKLATLAVMMMFIAAALWVVAYVVAHFPTR